jgi:hypothetical protein
MLLLNYCGCSNKQENTSAESILRAKEGGDFRGVNIGDDPQAIINSENGVSVYSMPDELVYRIDPFGKDSTWYEISYNFNTSGLYNINMMVFPKTDTLLGNLRNDFINYYLNKYGECQMNSGYCRWRAMTENGHMVSITISDTISGTTRPCLKVNFNESEN